MTVDGHTLYFSYDAAGVPLSVNFDGVEYFYVTNIQGDITGIVDSTGTTVVTYRYNVWGVPEWSDGTTNTTLKTLNPLRYRGYVYDEETNLYYLQSRYYNPEWGRFINADGLTSTGQGILGHNMFAYCNNNPVVFSDATGNFCAYSLMASDSGCNRPYNQRDSINTESNLRYYIGSIRDVTEEVEIALAIAANDAFESRFSFPAVSCIGIVKEAIMCIEFYPMVNHDAPWDIKREKPWEKTIGTDFPGPNAIVFFGDSLIKLDKLGNYTYGYLGFAKGISLDLLIVGSYYAAHFPLGGSDLREEISDWRYIAKGYYQAMWDLVGW